MNAPTALDDGLAIASDPATGQVASVRLYGCELLDQAAPCRSELMVNGLPLALRPHKDPNDPTRELNHLKGERFISHFTGWALVLARVIGERKGLKHRCVGVQTMVRRELCDQTCPVPGPGGPTTEAPLHVDAFTVLGWNWKFWGDDTRMLFCSTHASGPTGPDGHTGYENDAPEAVKRTMGNTWRRTYPGCMLIPGGVFHDAKTGQWIAITCRRPQVGFVVNIGDAGRGICYDFTLHAPFGVGESLQLPEIKLYFGRTHDELMQWIADFATHSYSEPPAWVHRTLFGDGLGWNNQPTWTDQAAHFEKRLDTGEVTGIGYCLVTNRPIHSGTTPLGYEPDPNHGTRDEFRAMCRRIAGRGVPLLVWMSHSGLLYQGGDEIDDDWFIRGVDDRTSASWGSIDQGGLTHINPGHPGYIAYTKKWIDFYVGECGAKGIFFDCLSWAFPSDFRKRPWMRYPGDTNRMAIRFIDEIHAHIKKVDPEAIMLGEGTTLDAPIDVFSINTNPKNPSDGLGPRDFIMSLNRWSAKRITIDQGPDLCPALGYTHRSSRPEDVERNRLMARLLKERGGPRAWTHLPGDLSLLGDEVLVVPVGEARDVRLPTGLGGVARLVEQCGGPTLTRAGDGGFAGVPTGIYRMER